MEQVDQPQQVAEVWFRQHGLPWFVDREDARVARALRLRNLAPALALITVLALVLLIASSGLYFTVYAVSDPAYRDQFFTRITEDLRRAVGVRAVYQAVRRAVR